MRTNAKKCGVCAGAMRRQKHEHTELLGAYTVKDCTALAWHCAVCDRWDLSDADRRGYTQRAVCTVLLHRADAGPEVYRTARAVLGVKQHELAALLGCAHETLCRWENGSAPMPRAMQLALVTLADAAVRRTGCVRRPDAARGGVGNG